MLFRLGLTVSLLSFAIALPHAPVAAKCNYNAGSAAQDCKDAIDDYWNKTRGNQSNSYRDIEKRVDTLKEIVQECKDCTMDQLEKAANKALGIDE